MKLLLPALALSLTLVACGNNDADNDTTTGADTTMASPVDGQIDAGMSGTEMNNMDGTNNATSAGGSMGSNTPSSNMNNAGGADNSGTGISGGQGNNASSGTNAAGARTTTSGTGGNTRAPYPVDGISTADGAAPTSTRRNRDNVTNDSLNNRSGMGSSR